MNQNKSKESCVYVIFTVTNTNIGKLIRIFTRNKYSHVSLAFDADLHKMYSFARYHINSPLSGGFVVEHPQRYLTGNRDVDIKVCKIPLNEVEYKRITKELTSFWGNREEMLYNTINAVLSVCQKKLKVKNSYTCIEFITYILDIKDILTIKELENKLETQVIYQGSLKQIATIEKNEDDYFNKQSLIDIIVDTLFHFKKIVLRVVNH